MRTVLDVRLTSEFVTFYLRDGKRVFERCSSSVGKTLVYTNRAKHILVLYKQCSSTRQVYRSTLQAYTSHAWNIPGLYKQCKHTA